MLSTMFKDVGMTLTLTHSLISTPLSAFSKETYLANVLTGCSSPQFMHWIPLLQAFQAYIASIISPLAGKTSLHVLNSKHFAETMRDVTINPGELLVSFDVCSSSMYPLEKQSRSLGPNLGKMRIWLREHHSHQIE